MPATQTRQEPTMDHAHLIAAHTQGAAAALAAHVTLRRALREKQERFNTLGLPRRRTV